MKKNVLVFGSIAGLVASAIMACSMAACYVLTNYHGNMWLGYGSMILAFSMIFVAVKNYRDKYNDGVISFGKAFQIGLYIALIASTIYVLTWLIEYYAFFPDLWISSQPLLLNKLSKTGQRRPKLPKQKNNMQAMPKYINRR